MTTTEPKSTLRGLVITQTVQTAVTVTLQFATAINTTSSALQVFGPRITIARVISQTFDPINYVATLQVFTSVQVCVYAHCNQLFTLHPSLFTLHSSLFTLHSSIFNLHSSPYMCANQQLML